VWLDSLEEVLPVVTHERMHDVFTPEGHSTVWWLLQISIDAVLSVTALSVAAKYNMRCKGHPL
jgi:hypothetical protein